jgi:hypothetical protein
MDCGNHYEREKSWKSCESGYVKEKEGLRASPHPKL